MAGYFLIDIVEITDRAKMDEYRKKVGPMIESFGGRYLIAGGPLEVVEGDLSFTFPVLIEFPSLEQAHRWYDSEEYKPLKELRLAASRGNAGFLPGR